MRKTLTILSPRTPPTSLSLSPGKSGKIEVNISGLTFWYFCLVFLIQNCLSRIYSFVNNCITLKARKKKYFQVLESTNISLVCQAEGGRPPAKVIIIIIIIIIIAIIVTIIAVITIIVVINIINIIHI